MPRAPAGSTIEYRLVWDQRHGNERSWASFMAAGEPEELKARRDRMLDTCNTAVTTDVGFPREIRNARLEMRLCGPWEEVTT